MSSTVRGPGITRKLWYRWKALRLPWRKQFLVGADLAGNTFWEFKDALNANRFRRIVRYGRTPHYADVKISPSWLQWLRHTRPEAPSIREQELDIARQAQMKQLAARADERWKSQESFLDAPRNQQTAPAIGISDPGGYVQQTEPQHVEGVRNAVESPEAIQAAAGGEDVDEGRFKSRQAANQKAVKEAAPWTKRDRGGPSENWQPESWTPGAAQKR